MFDFSWSEIMLIGVVALIAIGPKDLPVAIKAITGVLKKVRRMAGEFQGHVDEMMKEADMQDVRKTFNDIRSLNLRSAMQNTMDPDHSLNRAFDDPFKQNPVMPPPGISSVGLVPEGSAEPPPAFIPPSDAAPAFVPPPFVSPAFVPPPFVPPAHPEAAARPPNQADDI